MNKKVAFLICLLASQAYAADQFTDVRLYRPFSEAPHQVQARVTHTLKGWCWSQSLVDPRSDAWRCSVGSEHFDPCFVKTYVEKTRLVCPRSPWQANAVGIIVDKPLDNSSHQTLDMSKASPWGVELLDGTRCQLMASSLGGAFPNYDCGERGVLEGNFQRCRGLWKANLLSHNRRSVEEVEMTRVWF